MKKILLWAALLLALPAHADWVAIANNEDATQYVDLSTVKKTGPTRRVWVLLDYVKPHALAGSAGYLSIKSLDEYACVDERTRTLQSSAFSGQMGSGKPLASEGAGEWSYVLPESNGETLMKRVCSR
jgi:hypothetical protein